MSCNCGSNCGCGSDGKCGKRSFDLGSEEINPTAPMIVGFAPAKMGFEGVEMSFGAENGGCGSGCKCGSSCSCGSGCQCGK